MRKRRGLSRNLCEHILRDVGCIVGVTANLSERRLKNKIDMSTHDLRERVFRPIFGMQRRR